MISSLPSSSCEHSMLLGRPPMHLHLLYTPHNQYPLPLSPLLSVPLFSYPPLSSSPFPPLPPPPPPLPSPPPLLLPSALHLPLSLPLSLFSYPLLSSSPFTPLLLLPSSPPLSLPGHKGSHKGPRLTRCHAQGLARGGPQRRGQPCPLDSLSLQPHTAPGRSARQRWVGEFFGLNYSYLV